MVRTYFHSSIAHLERFIQDGKFSWTVNSCGHFLMVITNSANGGGKASARFSEHCSVSGLGQVWVRFGFRLGHVGQVKVS